MHSCSALDTAAGQVWGSDFEHANNKLISNIGLPEKRFLTIGLSILYSGTVIEQQIDSRISSELPSQSCPNFLNN